MIAFHIHLISSNIHVHSTNLYARLKISPLLTWSHARHAWLAPLDPIDQMGVVSGSMLNAWSDIISTSDIIRCLDDVDIFQPLRKEGGARTYKFEKSYLVFKILRGLIRMWWYGMYILHFDSCFSLCTYSSSIAKLMIVRSTTHLLFGKNFECNWVFSIFMQFSWSWFSRQDVISWRWIGVAWRLRVENTRRWECLEYIGNKQLFQNAFKYIYVFPFYNDAILTISGEFDDIASRL